MRFGKEDGLRDRFDLVLLMVVSGRMKQLDFVVCITRLGSALDAKKIGDQLSEPLDVTLTIEDLARYAGDVLIVYWQERKKREVLEQRLDVLDPPDLQTPPAQEMSDA